MTLIPCSTRRVLAAIGVVAALVAAGRSPASAAPRILIAAASGSLVVVDSATGRGLARVATRFAIDHVLTSPDGSRFVVFDGKQKVIAMLAADTLETLGTVTAGPCSLFTTPDTPSPALFVPGSQELLVTCSNALLRLDLRRGRLVQSLDMKGSGKLFDLPNGAAAVLLTKGVTESEVWLVDQSNFDRLTRIPLPSRVVRPRVTRDGRFFLVDELSPPDPRNTTTRRLHFIDVANRRASGVVDFPSGVTDMRQLPDGGHIYYLDRPRGVVHTVSIADQRLVRALDLGGPSEFVPGAIRSILIKTAGTDGVDHLRLLRGPDVSESLALSNLLRFWESPDGDRLVVLGAKAISEIQLPSFSVLGQVRLPQTLRFIDAWGAVDWNERRAAVLDMNTSSVVVADLAEGRVVGVASTGREGIGKAVARVAGESLAAGIIGGLDTPDANALLALAPDRPLAFTLNPRAGMLDAVSLRDGAIATTGRAQGTRLCFCLGPATLLVFRTNGVSMVDSVSLTERTRYEFGRAGRGQYTSRLHSSADRTRTVLSARDGVHLIDANGRIVSTIGRLASAHEVVFLP